MDNKWGEDELIENLPKANNLKKFTDEELLEIKEWLRNGDSINRIASFYGTYWHKIKKIKDEL